ncbi:MAG: hypothetical protein ACOY5Y_08900 [Pseudomonadota bacterium]
MSKIVIGRQFCGPPNSGNGGYVCGVLAKEIDGPATAVLRAPIPLDAELDLQARDGAQVLLGEGEALIAQGGPASQALPEPPPSPGLEAARAAAARHIGLTQTTHPICFTCGTAREEGDGLRVLPGQVAGAEPGLVACNWTPHEAFADAEGRIGPEIVWAALDCPGFFAWVEKEGRHGALLGTMTGEILRPVTAGAEYVVLAWPIAREGRKEIAGTAIYDADGQLVARSHQVWITMGPRPAAAAPTTEAAAT